MCGRYLLRNAPEGTTHTPWNDYWQDIQFTGPRYNICPSQQCPILRYIDGEIIADTLSWGFKPAWSKYNPSINARAEGLLESKMFKPSIRHKRCLVVADGFYEPKGSSGTKNRPWYCFEYKDQRAFAVAGIWVEQGFALITCEPNSQVKDVHDRMPLILDSEHWTRWLNPELQNDTEISYLLQPLEHPGLIHHRVGNYVKKSGNEGPQCLEQPDSDAI